VDAGKSTLISVLCCSGLDDGRGAARRKIFRHAHEVETGRTSSISQMNVCFSSDGRMLDAGSHHKAQDMLDEAAKVLTFVDLAGHERYLRTTCFGLTGHLPEYAMVLVGANAGLVGMCKEHLGIVLALRVPAFFVVSKVDFAPEEITKATVLELCTVLKKPGVRKRPFIVRTETDVFAAAANMAADAIAPIFLVSSVDGRGLDHLRLFLNLLPQRCEWGLREAEPVEFVIVRARVMDIAALSARADARPIDYASAG
jgi:GTPase